MNTKIGHCNLKPFVKLNCEDLKHFRISGFATVRTLLLLFCTLLPIFVLFSDLSKIFTSADQHSAQTTHFLEKEDFLTPTASSLHSGDR